MKKEEQILDKSTEDILYKFREFFNERYKPHQNEGWNLEILNVDVRDFINKLNKDEKEPRKIN